MLGKWRRLHAAVNASYLEMGKTLAATADYCKPPSLCFKEESISRSNVADKVWGVLDNLQQILCGWQSLD